MMQQPVTFLVVDDEDAAVRQLCNLAGELGHEATPARSTDEARNIINGGSRQFDCAIVDVMMPGEEGTALNDELVRRDTDVVYYTCNPALIKDKAMEVYEKAVVDAKDLLTLMADRAPTLRILKGIKSNTQELRRMRTHIGQVLGG